MYIKIYHVLFIALTPTRAENSLICMSWYFTIVDPSIQSSLVPPFQSYWDYFM